MFNGYTEPNKITFAFKNTNKFNGKLEYGTWICNEKPTGKRTPQRSRSDPLGKRDRDYFNFRFCFSCTHLALSIRYCVRCE